MRILFLHEVSYFNKPIFEMHEFPEHLAMNGHQVAFFEYLEGDESEIKSWGTHRSGRVKPDVKIRFYSQVGKLPGTLGRLIAVFGFPFLFFKVVGQFKPDLIVSYSVPTSGWQAVILARKLGIPLLFRALDISHKIRKTKLAFLVKIAERFVYRNASWISCNNPALRNYCVSMGGDNLRTSVNLPPLDLTHFEKPSSRYEMRAKLGIPSDAKVIMYMGSFFYFSGLLSLLEALPYSESRVSLLLIGGGEMESSLRRKSAQLRIESRVHFTGFVPYESLPDYFSCADVAVNPMIPSLVSNLALPNKVLQYMAAGLPVISTHLKGLNELLPNSKGLIYVDGPDNVLPKALAVLNQSDLYSIGKINKAILGPMFSRSATILEFESLLLEVAK